MKTNVSLSQKRFIVWMSRAIRSLVLCVTLLGWDIEAMQAGDASNETNAPAAARGYRLLTEVSFLPEADFDEETLAECWRVWDEPSRSLAEKADPQTRRRMIFQRYGLTDHPDGREGPAQYVRGKDGGFTVNCLSCHQGQLEGKVIPGLANADYAMQTIAEEMRATKLRLGKSLARFDIGSMLMPLGGSHGTTNAVMFGVGLAHYRDADLNFVGNRPPPAMVHHDHDAPAWWLYKRKAHIYIDGFAPRHHRALMQFMMVKENGPDFFSQHEKDFEDVEAYLLSLSAPKYPYEINQALANQGRDLFSRHCASCHGLGNDYPEVNVDIAEIGTDPVRWRALTVEHRTAYSKNWIGRPKEKDVVVAPAGYTAPPLDGVWATAPYFHNGSVPTLWHVLHPAERPKIWKRSPAEYDWVKVGAVIETFEKIPKEDRTAVRMRRYFNTTLFGKSNAGHDFPNVLNEEEKTAVLEFLKTL